MSLQYFETREFIPGLPFPGRPGFPDFFIPDFPRMKMATFPGKSGTANSRRWRSTVYSSSVLDC